jgi:hypothetical protein
MFEVQVVSSGSNVAFGKDATQSSDFKGNAKFGASKSIDGQTGTFSHTHTGRGCNVWWEVDLGGLFPIEFKIVNRFCGDSHDSTGCLCHLSYAAVSLLDDDGKLVDAKLMGNTCQVLEVESSFEASPNYCA